ncbi:MAG TPA: toll/interleukin-1 receptor domain-containing protein [Bryobacteraceae bacterium]|nr:toll/interleukin-1 receptor domain-containing protein [Bryobacteraceae bacterium]
MRSIVFCYAPADEPAARDLARFLEANIACQVSLDECRVRPDFDLIDAVDRALSADVAVGLFSPASMPAAWKRERWEPVFVQQAAEVGTPLALVLLEPCRFPELLRRGLFFDLSVDAKAGRRELKRRLMGIEGPRTRGDSHEALREAVADWPGSALDVAAASARAFAVECAGDFEGVYRIDCYERSEAGIIGDAGYAAGLTLAGNVEQNRAALIEACKDRRWLFIWENLPTERRQFVMFGGRSSALFVTSDGSSERPALETVAEYFLAATRDEALCGPLAGAATLHTLELLDSDFESGLRLGWAVFAVLKSAKRFAECVELLAAMEHAARGRKDAWAIHRIEWEQAWLCEDSETWGVRILPTAGEDVAQLSLFESLG